MNDALLCDWNKIKNSDGIAEYNLVKQICDLMEANLGSRGLTDAMAEGAITKCNVNEAVAITAAALGLTHVVKSFIDHGSDVNARSDIFGNLLCAAAASGSTELLAFLLDKGATIPRGLHYHNPGYPRCDVPPTFGYKMHNSPLQAAALNGHVSTVKLLLERDPSKELNENDHRQAALSAAMAGHGNIMSLLIHRWSSKHENPDLINMLWEAAANGHDALVRSLLDKGVHPNACRNESWRPPLSITAFHGRVHHSRFEPIHDERDALTSAARHGFLKTAKLLLERGAAIDDFTDRTSPLAGAVCAGQDHMVEWLLENGATLCHEEPWPKAFGADLLCRAMRIGYTSIVERLIEKGVASQPDPYEEIHRLPGHMSGTENGICPLTSAEFRARFRQQS